MSPSSHHTQPVCSSVECHRAPPPYSRASVGLGMDRQPRLRTCAKQNPSSGHAVTMAVSQRRVVQCMCSSSRHGVPSMYTTYTHPDSSGGDGGGGGLLGRIASPSGPCETRCPLAPLSEPLSLPSPPLPPSPLRIGMLGSLTLRRAKRRARCPRRPGAGVVGTRTPRPSPQAKSEIEWAFDAADHRYRTKPGEVHHRLTGSCTHQAPQANQASPSTSQAQPRPCRFRPATASAQTGAVVFCARADPCSTSPTLSCFSKPRDTHARAGARPAHRPGQA